MTKKFENLSQLVLGTSQIGSNYGVKIEKPKKLRNLIEFLFGEDQSRYLLEIKEESLKKVVELLKKNNIYYEIIGLTQKNFFEVEGEMKIDVNDLFKINNQWYKEF